MTMKIFCGRENIQGSLFEVRDIGRVLIQIGVPAHERAKTRLITFIPDTIPECISGKLSLQANLSRTFRHMELMGSEMPIGPHMVNNFLFEVQSQARDGGWDTATGLLWAFSPEEGPRQTLYRRSVKVCTPVGSKDDTMVIKDNDDSPMFSGKVTSTKKMSVVYPVESLEMGTVWIVTYKNMTNEGVESAYGYSADAASNGDTFYLAETTIKIPYRNTIPGARTLLERMGLLLPPPPSYP